MAFQFKNSKFCTTFLTYASQTVFFHYSRVFFDSLHLKNNLQFCNFPAELGRYRTQFRMIRHTTFFILQLYWWIIEIVNKLHVAIIAFYTYTRLYFLLAQCCPFGIARRYCIWLQLNSQNVLKKRKI